MDRIEACALLENFGISMLEPALRKVECPVGHGSRLRQMLVERWLGDKDSNLD